MINKCPCCGENMKVLLTGFYCPNDCDKKGYKGPLDSVHFDEKHLLKIKGFGGRLSTVPIPTGVTIFSRIRMELQSKYKTINHFSPMLNEFIVVLPVTECEYNNGAKIYIETELNLECLASAQYSSHLVIPLTALYPHVFDYINEYASLNLLTHMSVRTSSFCNVRADNIIHEIACDIRPDISTLVSVPGYVLVFKISKQRRNSGHCKDQGIL
jgi:hypothetical protein